MLNVVGVSLDSQKNIYYFSKVTNINTFSLYCFLIILNLLSKL